jgi:single-strand DNA-binding protein
MLNHIVLMGRLTRDPEMRRTGSGVAVVSFTIACERDLKNSNGEKETDFIDVTAWRNTAEFVEKYFSKGRMAVVSGRLQIRSWTDKDGNKRKTAEVVADNVYFGDSNPEGSSGGSYSTPAMGSYAAPVTTQASDFAMLEDDDSQLPF